MSKRIAFIFTGGRKIKLPDIRSGSSPEDFFYGAIELQRRGYDIDFLEDADFDSVQLSLWKNILNRIPVTYRLFDESAIERFRSKKALQRLNQYDILITTNNSDGLALAYLRNQKRLRSSIIFLSMCPIKPPDSWIKKSRMKIYLNEMIWGVENTHEIDFLKHLYPSKQMQMHYVPFGVDETFWKPGMKIANPPYVLSMGNDSGRDFNTLINAWKPEYPTLKLITRRPLPPLPQNIEHIQGDWAKQYLTDEAIRTAIQESLFVIIPVKETLLASGPSVAMQTMACQKALIINKTKGLWAPHLLQDGVNCLLPDLREPNAFAQAIESLLNDESFRDTIAQGGRALFLEHFTVSSIADRLEKLLPLVDTKTAS